MEENLFTNEWFGKCNKMLKDANARIRDFMTIVPPYYFGAVNLVCTDAKTCVGAYPPHCDVKDAAITWFLDANILAPGYRRFANIGILTTPECNDLYNNVGTPAVFLRIILSYKYLGSGAGADTFTSFSEKGIHGLRERTLLSDKVLYAALNSAIDAIPEFERKICNSVQSCLLDQGGRNAVFLFEKALFWMRGQRALPDVKTELEQIRDKVNLREIFDELSEIAIGIERTKAFTKSKIIKNYREHLERVAQKLKNILDS